MNPMNPRRNVTYSSRNTHAARSAHAKGEKLFRTYDTSYIRPKRSPVPAIIGIVVLIVAVVAIVIGLLTAVKGCSGDNLVPDGTEVQVVIEDGEGSLSVANTLVSAGLIGNAKDFTDRLKALGEENSLHPGTFTLVGGMSIDEMIAVLQTPVAAVTFTIPEGSTVRQTAQIVAEASEGRIAAADFEKAASNASVYAPDYSFLAEAGTNSLEGFLFPKTYPIDDNSTADSLIRTMLDQFKAEIAGLDFAYPESQGLSFYDAVKLASIVEGEEGGENSEQIASVFYNRLADGWLLQSDATMAYVLGREPTAEDIATYDDYNTYFVAGLPPTPINSPSLTALKAVCAPASTGYYYFYADENGQIYFSETYEEHQATFE